MTSIAFPRSFLWGAATSACQIEGSPTADGAAPSVWHDFARKRGKIRDGSNPDISCEHYRRYREDVRHMKELGLKAYRFSIAWPRIFPQKGRLNPKGIDFYSRLVDCLLEAGIRPFATIFHWDAPRWFQEEGGFVRRASVESLLEYGTAVFSRLGDRVKDWISLNEPSVWTVFGYALGAWPPGKKNDLRSLFHASHHQLLAHARLVEAFSSYSAGGRIGLAHHYSWVTPFDAENSRDVEAAAFMDDATNGIYMDSIFHGRYPERIVKRMGRFLPKGFDKDLPSMKKPGDFIGINYYSRDVYKYSFFQPYTRAKGMRDLNSVYNAMWETYPQGIYKTLLRLRDAYGNPPCYISENGYPMKDVPGADPLEDPARISFIADHVSLVGKAIQEGVDCRGYFHWSLLDNWEWAYGFSMRFGLLRNDFATQERSWKKSAYWYRDLIRANAVEVERLPPIDPQAAGGA
jgi:beta-glucosidase